MKFLLPVSFLFIVLMHYGGLQAQDTSAAERAVFVPAINKPLQELQNYLWVWEDKAGSLQIADMLEGKASGMPFRSAATIAKPDPFSIWWCKIKIEPGFSSDDFLIGVPFNATAGFDNGNDIADVWVIRNDQIIHAYQTGSLNPVSQRPVAMPINQNLFPITFSNGENVTIWWRIQRTINFLPPQFQFALQHKSIITTSSYIEAQKNMGDTALVYLGIMSILFFFGVVFFLITRQKTFIWFAIMAACLGLHVLILHPANYLTYWFFRERPVLQFHSFFLLTGLFNISILLFIQALVNTRKLLPVWNKIITAVIILITCVTIFRSIFLEVNPRSQIPLFISLLSFISSLLIGLRLVIVKNLFSQWMGGALLWLFSFQLLGLLWNRQVLPGWVFNPWVIAQVGMMIIIFFALAYRFKQSAKEKAEAEKVLEMDDIKSRFFANISHEFRTPLTLIQGPLQQIEENIKRKEGVVDVAVRHIMTMRRNTDRLLELVNQMLDLSKLDSGKMKLQIIKGDLLQLLKALASSFDSMAERKQIHYHSHFPEQTHIEFFDKDKLEKIFVNLLSNAFKFTGEKGTVSVIVELVENRLRLSVEDTGPGIAKKELDRVFDRFYQAEGTEDKGTGIGLALVKELVDLYRGQISVSSEPGKGSRFRVSLPIDKKAFKENELVYGDWSPGENFVGRYAGEKTGITIQHEKAGSLPILLVVEDNTDLRRFIAETVQLNYQVVEARNGKEGFELAISEIPDIIVSDVMMPEMDGFTMTEKIKKDERTSHIPVILLTAKAGQQHKIEGLKTGGDDYLTKPFDANELRARIQNLVNQRKILRRKFAGTIQLKPSEIAVNSIDDTFLTNVMKAIEKDMGEEEFSVEELAKKMAMSRSQLHRKLVALIDRSPSDLIRQTRLSRAKELLQKKASTPSEVAFKVGFSSHTYFSKCFKEEFGLSPGEV